MCTHEPPLPCPFCTRVPTVSVRVNSPGLDHAFVAFVACYCGGYASCAHQMGTGQTEAEALENALRAWNTRGGRYIPPRQPAPATPAT